MKPTLPLLVSFWLAISAAHAQVRSAANAPFYTFESGPVRALLLSPDGVTLYALNTADARVELLDALTMVSKGSVFTGLEPVAMALNPSDPNELWVVNQLSDSVSVVDLAGRRVKATLAAGDEPLDVAFAQNRAFVSCARAPSMTMPGAWDANVVVMFAASAPHARLGQTVLNALRPRALVASGNDVYVLTQNSGNHTTILSEADALALGIDQLTLDGYDQNFQLNAVLKNPAFAGFQSGWSIPTTGRVVFDFEYPALVHQLADIDVSVLDAADGALRPNSTHAAGTTLFAMQKSPFANELWIAGTDARNRLRFEHNVAGNAVVNQVAIATPGGAVQQVLSLAPPFTPGARSQPVQVAFSSTSAGSLAYVASFGTATVTVLDAMTKALVSEIATGLGPIGLATDSLRGRLYVYSRISNDLRVYDILHGHALLAMPRAMPYDPEPQIVRDGRGLLYDARAASGAGNGNMACATCHVFGHVDQLGWDLGGSTGALSYFFPDLLHGALSAPGQIVADFGTPVPNPMKGPMVTQSLRGLRNNDPLHWRGDRRVLQSFQPAFKGLLGGTGISAVQMQRFTSFVKSLVHAPNPFEPKDRVYTGVEKNGSDKFGATPGKAGKVYQPFSGLTCDTCHQEDFGGKTNFTGSQETVNFDGSAQFFNAAQLRGVYEKEFAFLSGFGILHDGSIDSIRDFLDIQIIGGDAFPLFTKTDRDEVAAFVKQWDTGLAPLTGAQFTLNRDTLAAADAFLDLAEAQAVPPASNVDLILKGSVRRPGALQPLTTAPSVGSDLFGAVFTLNPAAAAFQYQTDTSALGFLDRAALKILAANGLMEATFTCVPPGTGRRLGVDRDEDGLMDGDEVRRGCDAADPDSDDDGYADGAELALGGNPLVAETQLPDTTAPVMLGTAVEDAFVTTATGVVRTDEPTSALFEVGIGPGSYTWRFADAALASRHDVLLVGLPANTPLFCRITVADKNGNRTQSPPLSFATRPRHIHIDDMTLSKAGSGPYTLTISVVVRDQSGVPVVNAPVQAFWDGDIGSNPQMHELRTDGNGVATYTTQPFTPAGPTKITFSPLFLGSVSPTDPFFVGRGGQSASFFYAQPANQVNYREITVP
ncbi:MAG: hypothetical protein U1E76_22260 [Planctomycetota bacterium]